MTRDPGGIISDDAIYPPRDHPGDIVRIVNSPCIHGKAHLVSLPDPHLSEIAVISAPAAPALRSDQLWQFVTMLRK